MVWRCPKHEGSKKSIRSESWLEKSNSTMEQFAILAYLWASDIRSFQAQLMAEVSEATVSQHYQFFRDVRSHWLIENPQMLGGKDIIVEIDECVVAKRKYNRGRLVRERWVSGIYDLSKKNWLSSRSSRQKRCNPSPSISKTSFTGLDHTFGQMAGLPHH